MTKLICPYCGGDCITNDDAWCIDWIREEMINTEPDIRVTMRENQRWISTLPKK